MVMSSGNVLGTTINPGIRTDVALVFSSSLHWTGCDSAGGRNFPHCWNRKLIILHKPGTARNKSEYKYSGNPGFFEVKGSLSLTSFQYCDSADKFISR